jgi:hypothetical protein
MKKIIYVLYLFFSVQSLAVDVYDAEDVPLVSNPIYIFDHEVGARFDYFPVGAFNKHMGFSAEYTHYITDQNFAWSVLAGKSLEIESSLKTSLIESYGAQKSDFLVLNYYAKVGLSYVPFYTKNILFNSLQIHSKTFLNFDLGFADYTYKSTPFVAIGFAQSYYQTPSIGYKFNFDYMFHTTKEKYLLNQFVVGISMIYSWQDKPSSEMDLD